MYDLIPDKPDPTQDEVIKYVETESLDKLSDKVNELKSKEAQVGLSPVDKLFIEEYQKRIKKTGGRRISKKRPTARRRRSSKARKSRKSRSTRRR